QHADGEGDAEIDDAADPGRAWTGGLFQDAGAGAERGDQAGGDGELAVHLAIEQPEQVEEESSPVEAGQEGVSLEGPPPGAPVATTVPAHEDHHLVARDVAGRRDVHCGRYVGGR